MNVFKIFVTDRILLLSGENPENFASILKVSACLLPIISDHCHIHIRRSMESHKF